MCLYITKKIKLLKFHHRTNHPIYAPTRARFWLLKQPGNHMIETLSAIAVFTLWAGLWILICKAEGRAVKKLNNEQARIFMHDLK